MWYEVVALLDAELKARNLDGLPVTDSDWQKRRKELVDLLCREEYGTPPPPPDRVTAEVLWAEENFCAGKVTLRKVLLKAEFGAKTFSFPIYASIPNGVGRHPFFVHINFRPDVPDRYLPIEEICDNGFAVLSFGYEDVTSDDGDFTDGLAGVVFAGRERTADDCGKIALWAWAASRVLDYALTLPNLDSTRATVVGHSRLGKTALLAGALDERFTCVISNDSGCSGAAISRGKVGETIADICRTFPFWFCGNYQNYIDREYDAPFDQHFLLAAIAPRLLYVASAEQDIWADPTSEFLGCVAASPAYEALGLPGFLCPDRLPMPGDAFHAGKIGYHLRPGAHYQSREDWQRFIEFLSSKG